MPESNEKVRALLQASQDAHAEPRHKPDSRGVHQDDPAEGEGGSEGCRPDRDGGQEG